MSVPTIRSNLGERIWLEGKLFIKSEIGTKGCLVFGPYVTLWPGVYEVEFDIRANWEGSSKCVMLDVCEFEGDTLAKKEISPDELAALNNLALLSFETLNARPLEFRIHSLGRCELQVGYRRKLKLIRFGQKT